MKRLKIGLILLNKLKLQKKLPIKRKTEFNYEKLHKIIKNSIKFHKIRYFDRILKQFVKSGLKSAKIK